MGAKNPKTFSRRHGAEERSREPVQTPPSHPNVESPSARTSRTPSFTKTFTRHQANPTLGSARWRFSKRPVWWLPLRRAGRTSSNVSATSAFWPTCSARGCARWVAMTRCAGRRRRFASDRPRGRLRGCPAARKGRPCAQWRRPSRSVSQARPKPPLPPPSAVRASRRRNSPPKRRLGELPGKLCCELLAVERRRPESRTDRKERYLLRRATTARSTSSGTSPRRRRRCAG